ncbi:SDR family NAD(P)-dependent oxidoreductase [Paraburkholderia kururiensis]|uniref:SDR family NAD(P)-dependent oxidoreductase n=1 Tax=Paraburkholderia kururiensis TaxID=984307 RepID=UPI0020D04556|nr:SDR family NAD(P)-dependent oxidoreductase [Paraburkholderia kururiensis]
MSPTLDPRDQSFEEAIVGEHSEGDVSAWDADYRAFALDKARLSWRTGMGSHELQTLRPHLLVSGDTALWGSGAIPNPRRSPGRLDVVVNNAAVDVTEPIDVLTVAEWQRVLQTNLTGPFVVSRHAVTHMKTAGGGHIVNIASTAATRTDRTRRPTRWPAPPPARARA